MKLWVCRQTTRSDESRPAAGPCRQIRRRWMNSMLRRLSPEAPWVQRHVAHCPRCQRRLAALGKVDLALSFIKTQPCRLDLLTRANAAAMRMLNHSLQEAAGAKDLERAEPEPMVIEWCGKYRNQVVNVAACLAIVFLTKAGIFSSVNKACTRGEEALKQYYTAQAGAEVAQDLFGA